MRERRARLSVPLRAEHSRAIVARVMQLPAWASAHVVAAFASLPDEVQLADLIATARSSGRTLALPTVRRGQPLLFRQAPAEPHEAAAPAGPYGIVEPPASAPEVPLDSIDLVLVPALAVDARGYRLGYGAGYYDRTLPLATRATRVCVAFDVQIVPDIRPHDRDIPVHWVVTESAARFIQPR